MLLPAEIESKTLIPALRAILAKKLAEDHNVREDEISKMLGVTQAAVSNYIRGTRGDPSLIAKLLAEEQVAAMINELCDSFLLIWLILLQTFQNLLDCVIILNLVY
jgi:uncharacterized protein